MGFKMPKRTLRLVFEGDFEGAEVVCKRGVSMRQALSLQNSEEGSAEENLRWFAENALVSWNLEYEDGTPIPPTADGLLDVDSEFVSLVFQKYTEAVSSVGSPLGDASSNGAQLEATIPASDRS